MPRTPAPRVKVAKKLNERQRARIAANIDQRASAQQGRVVSHQGYKVLVAYGGRLLLADWRRNLGPIVCNDQVALSHIANDSAVIDRLLPRQRVFHRQQKPLASHIDQLLLVLAPEPPWLENLLERFLLAARADGLPLALVINQCDLALGDLRARLAAYDLPQFWLSAASGSGVDELRAWLGPGTTLLCGQSGVGKSSLVNRLVPEANIWTQAVSTLSRLGRHTTTNLRLYNLSGGGFIIDCPGVRGWPVQGYDPALLGEIFPEVSGGRCRFSDCLHQKEPGCAVREGLERGEISPQRWANYKQLREEISGGRGG